MIGMPIRIIKREGWKRFVLFAPGNKEGIERIIHQDTKLKFGFFFVDEIKRPTIRIGKFARGHEDFLVQLGAALRGRKRNPQINKLCEVIGVCIAVFGPVRPVTFCPIALARHLFSAHSYSRMIRTPYTGAIY